MSPRAVVAALVGVLLFVWSWLYRYNDTEGGAMGLLNDHFFYVVRGWQMLYGDLPDRDFVDPGAPLTFAVSAAAQLWLGRGVWSEIVVSVTALSIATTLVFALARRATGSTVLGFGAAVFQAVLQTRYYNYPKVLVYAVALPVLWAHIDRPSARTRAALAVISVVALLFRHDHGLFVGLASLAACGLAAVPWRERVRHAAIYSALVLLLSLPYLGYLQAHGGIVAHVETANSWSVRDRARAPLEVPMFTLAPGADDEVVRADEADWWQRGVFVHALRNYEPWLFWLIVTLPVTALVVVARMRPLRTDWPHAREKIAVTAGLGLVLIAGFIRGNLSVRFGDVSITTAVVAAWLLGTAWIVVRHGRHPVTRVATGVVALAALAGTLFILYPGTRERLGQANMVEKPIEGALERFELVSGRLDTWPLESWSSPDAPGAVRLAYYLRECTEPSDRVFLGLYLPEVPALAQRAFAGGHGDLRPGFFGTEREQRQTVARLDAQRVPLAFLPEGDSYDRFQRGLPRVADHFATRYRDLGEQDAGDGVRFRLFADKARAAPGTFRDTGWPCYRGEIRH
ncbi:MAG: hypothetical protein FJW23_06830 [Acidimicrobiia bacterium]|nr:hypothetical protein [Acidimicrobiia bacterium]